MKAATNSVIVNSVSPPNKPISTMPEMIGRTAYKIKRIPSLRVI